ncbi:MAG: UDP binding domain-containing protein, partial [Ktedonobacteraceae bacterium]
PGVGVGGHCIPVYPHFLLAGLQDVQDDASACEMLALPRAARRINAAMEEYAVARIEASMGSLAGLSVLILGVAYRGNVREIAFTSAQRLQAALLRRAARVYVDDPLFSEQELREAGYTSLPCDREQEIDAVILQANHQAYQLLDFGRFSHCRVVLDGRQALDRKQIEALGMRYLAPGDGAYVAQEKEEAPLCAYPVSQEAIQRLRVREQGRDKQ